jgi:uncharacterized membrane protein
MNAAQPRAVRADLLAVLALGALATIATFAAPHAIAVRAVFGLPFLALAPGYALACALYAREPPEPTMRLLLSLGLSVAAIVLAGLVLNAARIALTAHALVLAQLAVTALACLLAAVRGGPPPRAGAAPATGVLHSPWLASTAVLVVVFAALLVALARPLPDSSYAGYTQLSGTRAGADVKVQVTSAEHRRTAYRLEVSAASGVTVTRALTLAPEGAWSQSIHVGGPFEQTVRVRLYRASAPASVYRELVLRA